MCGRFRLTADPRKLVEAFDLPDEPTIVGPRYNIAPSQPVAVVGLKPDGRTRGLAMLKWGLVPHWANDPRRGHHPVNARAETVTTNPVFRDAFRAKRCLVPADGYYEWPQTEAKGAKRAVFFRLRGDEPFAFAGLWDVWGEGREKLVTTAFLTTGPNAVVAPVHDRMPLILPRESYAAWLSPDTPVAQLLALLRPYPADRMEAYRVGPAVNKATAEGPECAAPLAEKALF